MKALEYPLWNAVENLALEATEISLALKRLAAEHGERVAHETLCQTHEGRARYP